MRVTVKNHSGDSDREILLKENGCSLWVDLSSLRVYLLYQDHEGNWATIRMGSSPTFTSWDEPNADKAKAVEGLSPYYGSITIENSWGKDKESQ